MRNKFLRGGLMALAGAVSLFGIDRRIDAYQKRISEPVPCAASVTTDYKKYNK